MYHLSDLDLDSEGTFEVRGTFNREFPVHMKGYVDSVRVSHVTTSTERKDLVIVFKAEAGHTLACARIRDLLRLTMQHYPEVVAEVMQEFTDGSDTAQGGAENSPDYGGVR